MKAVVYTEYGPPDVLHPADVEKPAPKDNEILIGVKATPVNYGDLVARNFRNIPYRDFNMPLFFMLPSRLYFGVSKPRIRILGSEFSGEIEGIGRAVQRFKPGDAVFGYLGQKMGAYAEYLCISETGMVGIKPANLSHEEAACIPYGGIMALSHLRRVELGAGKKILINGASGGIGSIAVQLAKHFGAEVTGVCGTARLDYVRSLGADHVIDYTKEDFTKNGETYDVIYDVLGRSSFARCMNSLTPEGRYLLASFKTGKLLRMLGTSIAGKRKVICAIAAEKQEDMTLLRELAEAGRVQTFVDKTYPLDRAADAHTYVEGGDKKGQVVLTV